MSDLIARIDETMCIINEAEEAERRRLISAEETRRISEEVMADSMARLEREKQEALLLKEDPEFAEYERLKQKFKIVEKHK